MEEQKVIVNEKQMGNIEMEVVEKAEESKETEQSDIQESENRSNNPEGVYETTEKDLVEKGKIVTENDKKDGEEYKKMVTKKIEEPENGKKNSKGENEIKEEKIVEENECKGKERVTCKEDKLVTKEMEQAENENNNSKDETEIREVKRVKSEKEEKGKVRVTSEENKLVIKEMEEVEIEKNKSEEENELREVLEEDKERNDEEWMTGKEDKLVVEEPKENVKKSEKANEIARKEKDREGAVSGDNAQLPDSIDSQPTPKSLLLADEDDAEFHLWPSDVPLGPPSGRSGVCSPVNAFDDSLVDFDSVISAPSLEEALRQFEDGLERARLQNERAAQENSDSALGQYDNTGSAAGRASSEDANDYQSTPEGQYNSGEEQRAGDTGDSGYMSTDDLHNSLHRSPDVSSISGVPKNKSSPPHSGVKSDLPGRCKPFQKFTSDDKGHTGESGFMGPAEREIWGYQDDSDDESEWREGESTPVRYYPRVLSPGPPPMGPIAEEGEDGGHDGNKTVVPATGGSSAVKDEGLKEEKKASPSITHASKSTFSSSNKSPDSFDDSDNKSSDNASLADNERSATPSDDSRDMSPQGCRDTGEGDPCATSPPEKRIPSVGNSAVESARSHLERELSVPIIVIEDADLIDNLYTAFPPQIDRQVFSDSEVSGETQVKTRPRRRRLIYYDDTDLDVTKAVAASDASGKPRPESRIKTSCRKHGMRSREDKSGASSDGSPSNSQALLDTDGDVSSSILSECADGTSRSNEKFSVTTSGDGNSNLDVKLASSKGIGNETPANVFNDQTEAVHTATSGNHIHESVIPVQDIVIQNNLLVTDSTQYPDTDDGGSQSCVHTEGKEAVKADPSDASIPGDVPVKDEDTTPMIRTSNVTICVIGATPTPDILDPNGEADVRAPQDNKVSIPDDKDVDESAENATESEPAIKMMHTNEELVPISEVKETPGSTDGVITGGGQHPAELAGTEPPADHSSVASCLAAVPVPSRVPPSAAQKRVSHWKQLWDVRCSFQKKRDRDGGVRRKRKSPSIRIPGIVSRWRKSFEASAGSASSAGISGQGGAGASSCVAGASGMTRASRIRQWRQYWDGLASAEAAQAHRDAGATRKLSKLPPSAVALFDCSQRDDLGTPDECAPSAHQQSDSDLPALSSWRFQSPTPPPSYQELVLSGVIKPPQPLAPRKKHHRAHVQRAPPLLPLHSTPAVRGSLEDLSSHNPPTIGKPLQEMAALDTQTLTSCPTVVSSADHDPAVEDQKMSVIGAGQQKCTASAGVTPEQVNRYSISSISVGEGAGVRVVQSPDDILAPSQDMHEKPIVELREEVATPEPEPRILETKKPHISSRYISAIGAKEESITSTRPKTSKVVHPTNKKRAQLEEVADVPVKDLVRNVGPVKNVVIIPRTAIDDTSYTSVYSTERAMYRTGKMERVEVNANSFGSKTESSQDLSKKQEPRRETPTSVAWEQTVGEASGNLASPAVTEAAVTSRPSVGDRRQKEKDKVSLAEFLALEAQDFDSEDLASVQKLSGLFDEKKARPATPLKTQTPPRSPTRKPAMRSAPVTTIIGDSRDSEVQHLPEVKVPVVRVVVVEEEEKKQQPPSPSPSRRASFSGELRSRPTAPAVAAPRPWSPTPQPSAAAAGDQGAEDAESRNRFERARMFFQSLEKSQGSSSRSGSLDSAPPFAEAEDSLSSQRTKGHNRRRRRSGDGGSVTPGGGVQWETGGPRWQSRLGERPGGSERLPRKVSERFHVRDLFRDVLGEGGVRGIPHQQAVLAALRSVESDGSRPVSPYEELAASGGISSPDPDPYPDADSDPDPDPEPVPELDCRRGCSSPEPQAYLSEYPYLPKTPTRQFRPRPALLQPTLIPRRELLKTE
ncbi:uncharacterized protein LOC126109442 [Schistocerca cancellata]|uniref:uncharacterized protein LOC126109442 n=1 Tax=Schistocerca cancellata TaxID=274614 RepID=UPI002118962A|nr:uncharacterized protein LOC126109442 [Schistocerca cancellata]